MQRQTIFGNGRRAKNGPHKSRGGRILDSARLPIGASRPQQDETQQNLPQKEISLRLLARTAQQQRHRLHLRHKCVYVSQSHNRRWQPRPHQPRMVLVESPNQRHSSPHHRHLWLHPRRPDNQRHHPNVAARCLDLCKILGDLCLDLCKILAILCLDLCKKKPILCLDLCRKFFNFAENQ